MIQRPGTLERGLRQVVHDELRVVEALAQVVRRDHFELRLQPHEQHFELVESDRLAEGARDVDAHREPELRRGRQHAAVEPACDQHFRIAIELRELAQELDAVAPRHLQIEQNDGRREREHRRARIPPGP